MSSVVQKKPPVLLGSRWTEPMHDRLAVLWKVQNSASIIAEKLFNEFGVAFTRNAVIGKIHRLGLSGEGASSTVSRKGESKPRRQKPKLVPTPRAKKPEWGVLEHIAPYVEPTEVAEGTVTIPVSARVTLEDLRSSHCRWPLGDPRDENFSYCGDAAVPGKPYCPLHYGIAYVPIRREKKVAWRAFR